ncbi:MAG: MgtC/SapB family protein [Chitinophagales bacterium]|nr:MgtC/SapB family protein [Chitinophagales bacterium]
MELQRQFEIALQIISAMLLGGIIGYEREKDGKAAGIRTYAAVCMGSCIFTLIGVHLMDADGTSRMVSNIITGIGFLGAGIIFKDTSTNKTRGLTTAATIWATAAVGVAVGYLLYAIAIISSCAIYFLLSVHHFKWFVQWTKKLREKHEQKHKDEPHDDE